MDDAWVITPMEIGLVESPVSTGILVQSPTNLIKQQGFWTLSYWRTPRQLRALP